MAVAKTKTITYQAYLDMPEIKKRYEILDGEMVMAPSPTYGHQSILRTLFLILNRHVTEHNLGEVLFAPLDVVIRKRPLRTRQPDLLFIGKPKVGLLRADRTIEIPPDLVIEILSPGDTRSEVLNKLMDYGQMGVRECWVVSPEAHTIEVMRLSAQGTESIGAFEVGSFVRSEILETLSLKVDKVFA